MLKRRDWEENNYELWAMNCFEGGSNSVVESQPSKLLVAGSNPVSRSKVWRFCS
jgi:hypothetical protein